MTLSLAAVLAALTSLMVIGYEPEHDLYLRVLGVVAILDVLGTVVVAALVKFGPSTEILSPARSGLGGSEGSTANGSGSLPADLTASMVAYAAAHQISPHDVVERAVRDFLARETTTDDHRPRAEEEPAR